MATMDGLSAAAFLRVYPFEAAVIGAGKVQDLAATWEKENGATRPPRRTTITPGDAEDITLASSGAPLDTLPEASSSSETTATLGSSTGRPLKRTKHDQSSSEASPKIGRKILDVLELQEVQQALTFEFTNGKGYFGAEDAPPAGLAELFSADDLEVLLQSLFSLVGGKGVDTALVKSNEPPLDLVATLAPPASIVLTSTGLSTLRGAPPSRHRSSGSSPGEAIMGPPGRPGLRRKASAHFLPNPPTGGHQYHHTPLSMPTDALGSYSAVTPPALPGTPGVPIRPRLEHRHASNFSTASSNVSAHSADSITRRLKRLSSDRDSHGERSVSRQGGEHPSLDRAPPALPVYTGIPTMWAGQRTGMTAALHTSAPLMGSDGKDPQHAPFFSNSSSGSMPPTSPRIMERTELTQPPPEVDLSMDEGAEEEAPGMEGDADEEDAMFEDDTPGAVEEPDYSREPDEEGFPFDHTAPAAAREENRSSSPRPYSSIENGPAYQTPDAGRDLYSEDEPEYTELVGAIEAPDEERERRLKLLLERDRDPFLQYLCQSSIGRLIATRPWSKTAAGHIRTWHGALKAMVSRMVDSPFRECIILGHDHLMLYNEQYLGAAGGKHPLLMGQKAAEGWGELWDELGPVARSVMQGETVSFYDHLLLMERNGFKEETFHIFAYIPFRDSEGKVLGISNSSFEVTSRVVAERRLATMRDLVQATSLARTSQEYYSLAMASMASNPVDIPFAMLYTATQGSSTTVTVPNGSRSAFHDATAPRETRTSLKMKLLRQGLIGVDSNHELAPAEVNVSISSSFADIVSPGTGGTVTSPSISDSISTDVSDDFQPWPFLEAAVRREPVFVHTLAESTHEFESRGWPERPRHAVVLPCAVDDDQGSVPAAFLVLGINSLGTWDDAYATFLKLLARHIATGLVAVTSAEHSARKTEELMALDRAKTAFFANCSHELRTPLTLILGPLEDVMSGRGNLIPVDKERLQTVQRNANRLLHTVNNLLDFTKMEAGKSGAVFRPSKISSITKDLASLFRAAIERAGVKYSVVCDPDPPGGKPVYLALDLYEKCLFNLIGNSIKFCMTGEIKVQVRYTSADVTLSVSDTGCGIATNELDRIFERFHRVESISRTHEGTGIGLSLTLEVVKTHGGQLSVQSELGKGSTFTVQFKRGTTHLPAAQVDVDGEVVDETTITKRDLSVIEQAESWRINSTTPVSLPSSGSNSSGAPSSGEESFLVSTDLMNLGNSVVMLVDDNADLRNYLAGVLSKAVTVIQFSDGQSALEHALKKPPSLVVTDIMMPRLDGRGLLAGLRNNPSTSLIPIIFISAQAGSEARAEALESGADDYLVKPFVAREFLARVNVHLQLGKMRHELEKRVGERTRALIESEARYRGLADQHAALSRLSPVGIFVTDRSGYMNWCNQRWHEITGHPQDAPLSLWRKSIWPDDVARVEEMWKQTFSEGVTTDELEFRFKDGNWAQCEIRPLEGGQGYVGALTDITHQKEVERLRMDILEQRAQEADENRRRLELFIDFTSHELRNPLNGVYQNAQAVGGSLETITAVFEEMRLGELPNAQKLDELSKEMVENAEAVENILLCANHQGRIADEILSASKLQMGLLTISPVPFKLVEKVRETVRMFELECQAKGIDLGLEEHPSIQTLDANSILADANRIAQVLLNFVSNAIKHSAVAPTRSITIHLDAFSALPAPPPSSMRIAPKTSDERQNPDGLWISIGVADSGKGLSPDEMNRLFARFSQVNPKTDQYNGSGLGLHISAQLIELHGGVIEVESKVGKGSTFRFFLPTVRALVEPEPVRPKAVSRFSVKSPRPVSPRVPTESLLGDSPQIASPLLAPTPRAKHCLIVEDNLINQKVMQRQLRSKGYRTSVAGNGQEGLAFLKADQTAAEDDKIDIVLMDIEMPVMDGLTAIKLLRKMEGTGEMPKQFGVIAVTGNARQEQVDLCLASGFSDVIIKPYHLDQLLDKMEQLLDRMAQPEW